MRMLPEAGEYAMDGHLLIRCLHHVSLALLVQTLGSPDELISGTLLLRWPECLTPGGHDSLLVLHLGAALCGGRRR